MPPVHITTSKLHLLCLAAYSSPVHDQIVILSLPIKVLLRRFCFPLSLFTPMLLLLPPSFFFICSHHQLQDLSPAPCAQPLSSGLLWKEQAQNKVNTIQVAPAWVPQPCSCPPGPVLPPTLPQAHRSHPAPPNNSIFQSPSCSQCQESLQAVCLRSVSSAVFT